MVVAVSGLVSPLDQITGLLKLDREKESGRRVNAFCVNAALIATAAGDPADHEVQTALISGTVEKIQIVLFHKKRRIIDRIGSAHVAQTTGIRADIVRDFID